MIEAAASQTLDNQSYTPKTRGDDGTEAPPLKDPSELDRCVGRRQAAGGRRQAAGGRRQAAGGC